jgi:hypothetical protein
MKTPPKPHHATKNPTKRGKKHETKRDEQKTRPAFNIKGLSALFHETRRNEKRGKI